MKHKRKKTKRNVRCTLCTTHRWQGNNTGRFKSKEEYSKKTWKKLNQNDYEFEFEANSKVDVY